MFKVTCNCGVAFKAKEELSGKQVRCPSCKEIMTVPLPPDAPRIPVACPCGKSFQAKPELAGKNVQCPGCQQTLKIPFPTSSATTTTATTTTATPAQTPTPQSNPLAADPLGLGNTDPFASAAPANDPFAGAMAQPSSMPPASMPPASANPYAASAPLPTAGRSLQHSGGRGMEIAAGVFCIIHFLIAMGRVGFSLLVLSRAASQSSFNGDAQTGMIVGFVMLAVPALMSLCVLISGVGVLMRQPWSYMLGFVVAIIYFIFLAIGVFFVVLGMVLIAMRMPQDAVGFLAIGLVFNAAITIVSAIGPALLIVVRNRRARMYQ